MAESAANESNQDEASEPNCQEDERCHPEGRRTRLDRHSESQEVYADKFGPRRASGELTNLWNDGVPVQRLIWVLRTNSGRRTKVTIGLAVLLLAGIMQMSAALNWKLLAAQVLVLGVPLFQSVASSFFYSVHRARPVPEPKNSTPSIDVFVTACGEDSALICETLKAARDMRGNHKTWLLDDADDPIAEHLATNLGVGYLRRNGCEGFKAGNINSALKRTSGEIVVIFDVDHQPRPDFLERSIGHFENPEIGFTQVMVTFRNSEASWTARASAETSYDYFSLISVGKDVCGATTLMGSNALIRRSALNSIGGYRIGLAEDLETSLALHAEGWSSAYVAEPLAPGLSPEDYTGFKRQQKKWARGVMEAAWKSMGGSFHALTNLQRLGYLLRFLYYVLVPIIVLCNIYLAAGLGWGYVRVEHQLRFIAPLLIATGIIRFVALRYLSMIPEARTGTLFRGSTLVLACWPAYCKALIDFIMRRPIQFVATPKAKCDDGSLSDFAPQFFLVTFQVVALVAAGLSGGLVDMPVATTFCLLSIASNAALIPAIHERVSSHRTIASRERGKTASPGEAT